MESFSRFISGRHMTLTFENDRNVRKSIQKDLTDLYELGYVIFIDRYDQPYQVIPPHFDRFVSHGVCFPECTEEVRMRMP